MRAQAWMTFLCMWDSRGMEGSDGGAGESGGEGWIMQARQSGAHSLRVRS